MPAPDSPLTVEAALQSGPACILVVTGHRAAEVEAQLDGLAVGLIRKPDHAQGMASSLRAGIAALDAHCDGVAILLDRRDLRQLMAAFPAILPRAVVADAMQPEGDVGACHIIEHSGLIELDIGPSGYGQPRSRRGA